MFNVDLIRDEFPILEDIIYLDTASTSLTPECVVEAINSYYHEYNANIGRGAYSISIKASETVDKARTLIGEFINASPEEIIFTKNTTEGINILANGLEFKKGDNVIVSNIEHHSNLVPWLNLKGVNVKILEADTNGMINPEDLNDLIDENTRLVSITHVNNAIGTIQDVKKICEISKEQNTLTHIDCAQSLGHIKVDLEDIKPDFISAPGHKGLMGPTGTGFLYMKKGMEKQVKPKCLGGGTVTNVWENGFTLEESPHCYEGGTLNIAGIFGLKKAIEYINTIGLNNIEKYTENLTKKLYTKLKNIENIEVYGDKENLSNIVSFNVKDMNPHDVSKILDETGKICLRSGQHCAIPSLNLIGANNGSLRASLHCYNTLNEIEILTEYLEEIGELR